ncbi:MULTISPECIES: V-type ATP synthase subunit E family protein [unclassified Clostridium]|jgi:V/A-type H+-transporting ATPase subunit E|uniref:V-type ATP synthase subunit E n=1 Tax=Clostridium TaxID=1485 RepID=UPI001C8CD0E7|nr:MULTISPECIES: V-type ATP synthase subunit E family protein [unclassified Clostridium]MBX9138525.1 V-type ATP synthase subunit E [Clostridium sp. K12(2020)]MBX9145250.1 V-type ATP synthase subunit E [Clostridium sp. K13]MDU2288839.1 V-type ATP synthase subunit E family protein [Clostridium celatum]MDU4327095.1 V-type ATP synthase subunit E family protein [Clostridium celatum]
MSNVKNMTSKILKDAEAGKENILAAAEEEKNKIISKKVSSANEIAQEILEKAEVEAKSKKERVISSAKLKVRNNKLAAKQEIIDEVFEKSIDKLTKLSKEDFLNFVKNAISSMNLSGKQTLILNEEGLKFVDEAFIDELNKNVDAQIILGETAGNFKGGFILENNGIEINSTYEALVSSLRDELEFEVAKVLFN